MEWWYILAGKPIVSLDLGLPEDKPKMPQSWPVELFPVEPCVQKWGQVQGHSADSILLLCDP